MRTRRVRDIAAVAVLAAVLVGGPALSAAADEPIPGQDEVRRAQQHTDEVASRVAAIEGRLRASEQRVEAANVALSEAAEDYDYAQVKLAEAEKAETAARAVAEQAGERLDGAQEQVGQLAAQAYRSGGGLANLEVLLSPEGPDDVIERASMMQVLAGQQQRTVRRADSARMVATSLTAQAEEALKRRQAAADELAEAKDVAEQRATAAQQALTADAEQKNQLLAELAEARSTSLALERQRQDGLRRQAEARREAAARESARKAAERETAADTGSRPSSGNSGSGSSSGSSGGSSGRGSSGGSGGSGSSGGSGGSGGSTSSGGGSSSGTSSAGATALAWAKDQLGLPYRWGGEGPGSYDCSGLTMKAWARAGVSLPHSSRLQYQSVEHISYSQLRPGDLVFFGTDTSNPSTIHHVAMYVGDGKMIEAPYTGAYIRIVPLRSSGAMPYAGRV